MFVVGQTGTLVRLTENVGHFDMAAAESRTITNPLLYDDFQPR